MQKVFITGITGLLGARVLIDLLESGFPVKALLRRRGDFRDCVHPNLELIEGDLFSDIEAHLTGVEVFIHIAAETRQNRILYSDYHEVNVEATKRLLTSCIQSGVKRFIYVSTANTLGYGSITQPGNEDAVMREPYLSSYYAKSKSEAENFVRAHNDRIETVIIHPTFIIGANEHKSSSVGIIAMGMNRRMVFCPPGGKNFVNVADVSKGILNSIHMARSGESYLLANENLTYLSFFKILNTAGRQKPIILKLPASVLMVLGSLGDVLRKMGMETNLSSVNMKILCIHNYYSNAKSIRELNMNYQPVRVGIEEAVHYFRSKA